MASREHCTCDLCRRDRDVTRVGFFPSGVNRQLKVKPYGGTVGVVYDGEFSMAVCDRCGKKKGSSQRKTWIWWFIGNALYLIAFALLVITATKNKGVNIIASVSVCAGWFITMVTGIMLAMKARYERGAFGIFMGLFCQFWPGLGLLSIALHAKQINRGARAESALRPSAQAKLDEAAENDRLLKEAAESGAATDPEMAEKLEKYRQEKEAEERTREYARAEQQEKMRSSNVRGGIFGLLFTIGLGIYGASVYSSGRGYMELFHSIKLSPGAFAAVIGVLLVIDIISIVNASKK